MSYSEALRTYEQIKKSEVAVAATNQVKPDGAYLDVMNYWDGQRISPQHLKRVEEITNLGNSVSTGRLLIRLAILQALADERKPLSLKGLREYWNEKVPSQLKHPNAQEVYHRATRVHPHDVASLAGVPIPNRSDPTPHPNPPIRVHFGSEKEELGGKRSAISSRPLTRAESDELERVNASLDLYLPTERETVVKSRVNHGLFRERLLSRWKVCSVTGVGHPKLLIASHIKPWRMCERGEHLDPDNGLLLNPTLDKLFDTGLMTFGKSGDAVFSDELSVADRELLQLPLKLSLRETDGRPMSLRMEEYMTFHRKEIFRKNLK